MCIIQDEYDNMLNITAVITLIEAKIRVFLTSHDPNLQKYFNILDISIAEPHYQVLVM